MAITNKPEEIKSKRFEGLAWSKARELNKDAVSIAIFMRMAKFKDVARDEQLCSKLLLKVISGKKMLLDSGREGKYPQDLLEVV